VETPRRGEKERKKGGRGGKQKELKATPIPFNLPYASRPPGFYCREIGSRRRKREEGKIYDSAFLNSNFSNFDRQKREKEGRKKKGEIVI